MNRSRTSWGISAFTAALIIIGARTPARAQSQTKEVRERVSHAVVEVFTARSEQQKGDTPIGSGSGSFVNRTGLCITNNHVVDPTHGKSRLEKQRLAYSALNRLVWTVIVDGGTDKEKKYEAFVLYQNDLADQAILQVYDDNRVFLETPNYLKFYPGHRLKLNQKLWCYGFPGGDARKSGQDKHPQVAISEGHIVDLPRRPDGDLRMIITDTLVDPGNSGGPMVDIEGYFVGTATLKPPAEVAGRANQSALVPADLTRQFITNAFQRGKLESGIDLEPFYTHLVGRDGYVDVPGFPRQAATDCLFQADGNRICGAPAEASITMPTPLGKLTLPCAQMAYLLKQDNESGIILMDGGQRLPFKRAEAVLKFKPTGGDVIEKPLKEVNAVAFRKTGTLPEPPRGKNLLIGGDNYYLLLKEVAGEAKFASEQGMKMSRPLQAISTIESSGDNRVVHFSDGSQVTGKFEGHEIKAVLAINGAPQTLSLAEVRDVTFDEIESGQHYKREVELTDLFAKAPPEMLKLAEQVTAGKFDEVKSKLAPQMVPEVFNKQGTLKKDQLRLLEAMCAWGTGDFAAANRGFKKLGGSETESIKWFARARLALLEKYPDGKSDGKPLSDPKVLKSASAAIARETLHDAKELLSEREAPPPENRGMFMALKKKFDKMSDELHVASQLGNQVAGVALVWMWSWESDLLLNERERLAKEFEAKGEELKTLQGTARDYTGRRLQKEMEQLQQTIKATEEWYTELSGQIHELGFIIDDPDLDLLG